MHNFGICHRDLKPDNFMFESKNTDVIQCIDFGLAKFFSEGEGETQPKIKKMITSCGTTFYMAPEVIMGNYNQLCDVWSLGVILHLMILGEPIFYDTDEDKVYEQILSFEKLDLSDAKYN